jgi:hypothetical protein
MEMMKTEKVPFPVIQMTKRSTLTFAEKRTWLVRGSKMGSRKTESERKRTETSQGRTSQTS